MNVIRLHHALRDLRRNLHHLRLFSFCLILSVSVMSGIGLTVANIKATISYDAASLLGGDLEIRKLYKPLKLDAESFLLFNSRRISRTMDMRTMARKGKQRTLVELKAIDRTYPLYGVITYKKSLGHRKRKKIKEKYRESILGKGPPTALGKKLYNASVDQSFLDLLQLRLGGIFKIGGANFIVNRLIKTEPDRGFSTMTLGPRVMVSHKAFHRTELVQPGSMIYYRYRILLAKGISSSVLKEKIAKEFPDSIWKAHDWNDSTPGLLTLIDRLSLFFTLTAITALAISGIGIAGATNIYIWKKRQTIALMKSMGASQKHIDQTYLIQILLVSIISIGMGCLLGVATEVLLLDWLSTLLHADYTELFHLRPIIVSALLALTTVLLFTLIPLFRSRYIKPAALLRGHSEQSPSHKLPTTLRGIIAGLLVILIWLTTIYTNTAKITLLFSAGLGIAMFLFYALGGGLQHIAKRAAHSGYFSVAFSITLANIARPGAATRNTVMALGISMSLVIALIQIGGNLRMQIEQGLPQHAPSFFLADIQPSQLRKLKKELKKIPGTRNIRSLPVSRGRIVQLNGVQVRKLAIEKPARWAIRNERGLTQARKPPKGTVIVEGKWWPKKYKGPPLMSFDKKLAEGMGLTIGDTITIATINRSFRATIANLRDIGWGTLQMNFAIILSPGSLKGLPITHLMTLHLPERSERAVQQHLADNYANVVTVRVREVLGQVSTLLETISAAVLLVSAVTVLCGILVMAGAIYASCQRRLLDTAIYKLLGADKKRIQRIYLVEFIIIAVTVAVIAVIVGSVAAYGVMQLMILSQYQPLPGVVLSAMGISLALAIILGLAATHFTLAARPLSLLRNE